MEQREVAVAGLRDECREAGVDWWSVYIEARTDGKGVIEDDAPGRFSDLVQQHHGVVSAGGEPPRWSAQISVKATNAAAASAEAISTVTVLALEAGLPVWPVARVEAVREDALDEELRSPR